MKWAVVGFYFLSILHIHFRGRVRLPFRRQLFDHSSFMAPINIFMHKFSRVPATPYIPLSEFPELQRLQDNWQVIRAEAENLLALKKIKAAEQNETASTRTWQYPKPRIFLKKPPTPTGKSKSVPSRCRTTPTSWKTTTLRTWLARSTKKGMRSPRSSTE